jgi:hypothetical protein
MHHPSFPPPWSDHPNCSNIWWRLQILKLLLQWLPHVTQSYLINVSHFLNATRISESFELRSLFTRNFPWLPRWNHLIKCPKESIGDLFYLTFFSSYNIGHLIWHCEHALPCIRVHYKFSCLSIAFLPRTEIGIILYGRKDSAKFICIP